MRPHGMNAEEISAGTDPVLLLTLRHSEFREPMHICSAAEDVSYEGIRYSALPFVLEVGPSERDLPKVRVDGAAAGPVAGLVERIRQSDEPMRGDVVVVCAAERGEALYGPSTFPMWLALS